MKKTLSIIMALILAFAAVSCTGGKGKDQTEVPKDPYAYTLGTPVEFDPATAEEMFESLKGSGEVYQFVLYKPKDSYDMIGKAVYKYDPYLANSEIEKTLFRDKYYLSAASYSYSWAFASGLDTWNPEPVSDPAVFGAFEDLIMGLELYETTEEPILRLTENGEDVINHFVNYSLETVDGEITGYHIFNDGSVVVYGPDKSGDESVCRVAKTKLSEQAVAFFFVAALNVTTHTPPDCNYHVEAYADHNNSLKIKIGDAEIELEGSECVDFLELLPHQKDSNYAFDSHRIINDEVEDHGTEVLSFGAPYTIYPFVLYSDGTVIVHYDYIRENCAYFHGASGQYINYLTADMYIVSDEKCDVNAVLEFLNNKA